MYSFTSVLHIIHVFLGVYSIRFGRVVSGSALYYGGSGFKFDSEILLFWLRFVIVLGTTRLCRVLQKFVSHAFHRIT